MNILHKLTALLLLLCATVYGDYWKPDPPVTIPGSTATDSDIYTSYDSNSGTFLATWKNIAGVPTYATYNGTTWSAPTTIPGASVAYLDVLSAYDAAANVFLVTWTDQSSLTANYAVFNGSTWTTSATPIPNGAYIKQPASYSNNLGTFVSAAAFDAGGNNNTHTAYAIFDALNSTWTTPFTQFGVNGEDYTPIFITYSASSNLFLATWPAGNNLEPRYSFFNGTNWTQAATLATDQAEQDVFPSAGAGGTFIATWVDLATHDPVYSVYNGTSWSPRAQIPGSAAATSNVTSSFDPVTGEFLVTWQDFASFLPYYSIFNGTSWTTPPTQIPNSMTMTSGRTVFSSFSSKFGFLVTWPDESTTTPFYSLFNFGSPIPPTPPAPASPTNFTGYVRENRFLTQKQYVLHSTWDASASANVVSYLVLKNGVVVADVPATSPLVFKTTFRSKESAKQFSVVAVNSSGVRSAPTPIVIVHKRK